MSPIIQTFPTKKIQHFSAPCQIQIIGITIFNGQFIKIALPVKLLTVLYTTVISQKSRSMKLIYVSN